MTRKIDREIAEFDAFLLHLDRRRAAVDYAYRQREKERYALSVIDRIHASIANMWIDDCGLTHEKTPGITPPTDAEVATARAVLGMFYESALKDADSVKWVLNRAVMRHPPARHWWQTE